MAEQNKVNTAINFSDEGRTGIDEFGGQVYEEFLPQLRYPNASKVFKEMADNDPTIGAILYMSEQLIRKADWSVEAASNSVADQEAAEFLEQCMNDMSMSWANVVSEILSKFTYGWSFHEVVYKVRRGPTESNAKFRSKYTDGRIGWRKMPVRSQHTLYGWVFDDTDGGLVAMEQQSPPSYQTVTIPLSKGLLFRTKISRDNPEGRSLLRNAYRPWYFKKRIEEIEGIGIERDLAGLPILIPPENVDIWDPQNQQAVQIRNKAETLVRNVRRDQSEGVVIPFGWDFKLLSTGGTRQFDTNAIINRYDQRMAITMLADIVMLGADKVGSFGLADAKKSLLAASLEGQINNIADVFNQHAVPKLFSYNDFPNITDYPKVKPGEVEVPSVKDLAFLLRASGLDVTKDIELMNFLRRIASIPKISEEDFNNIYNKKEEPKPAEGEDPDDLETALNSGDTMYEGK